MGKKLSYEFVKSRFEIEGYTLISTEYINSTTKLEFICPNEHKHFIKWNDFKSGYRCGKCYGNVKLSINDIRSSFKKEGYTLLSTVYTNARFYLEYKCPNGHKGKMIWINWYQGNRCGECEKIRKSESMIGSMNFNWRGGIAYAPYCSQWGDKEYKKFIRDRDGNRCLNPCCNNKDKRLVIHHIDYNKKNCRPSNLITVCSSCNTKANFNRKWHVAWYQSIIKKRYNIGAINGY